MFKINMELKQTLFIVLLHISDILIYFDYDNFLKNSLIQVITNKFCLRNLLIIFIIFVITEKHCHC